MKPELFDIPFFDMPVKAYGFMMMLGFLTAVWMGMRRAERVKANPDMILNCGMICLIFGVGGARLFYVIHYWESNFAHQKNPLMAALDITAGGLEYLGGVIGAVLGITGYFALYGRLFARGMPRPSLRLYLDLVAPLSIWGLALTRVGCFLNGCCWGGLCTKDGHEAALPWAVSFPFNSPAHERQWMERQVRVPAELIVDDPFIAEVPMLVPRNLLELTPETSILSCGEKSALGRASGRSFACLCAEPYQRPVREFAEIDKLYQAEKAKNPNSEEFKRLESRWKIYKAFDERTRVYLAPLLEAQAYTSRKDPSRPITATELRELAEGFRSLPVHPTQLYDTVNALLLSWLLWVIYGHRKRHGVVFGWMLLLYPWSRLPLEAIRVDNPHDAGGLTISQAVSLGMLVIGILWMLVMYRLPQRSPLAVPWIEPRPERDSDARPAKSPAPA